MRVRAVLVFVGGHSLSPWRGNVSQEAGKVLIEVKTENPFGGVKKTNFSWVDGR